MVKSDRHFWNLQKFRTFSNSVFELEFQTSKQGFLPDQFWSSKDQQDRKTNWESETAEILFQLIALQLHLFIFTMNIAQ